MQTVINALSVDVEDYYQVIVFQKGIDRSEWSSFPSRVEQNTDRLLEMFAARGATATFFCLGCVAEQHPALIRRIAAAGHEVGSHGWGHEPVHALTRDRFSDDIRKARALLEDLTGTRVEGFRAPSFSIRKDTLWALDEIKNAGYAYDSSIFPIGRPDYGIADAPRAPYTITTPGGSSLVELPLTVSSFLGRAVPVAGGGYFRMLPYVITRWGFAKVNREGRPGVFYLHPWEVDPEQPDLRRRTTALGGFRHYVGLRKNAKKLDRLLADFTFRPAREVLASCGLLPGAGTPCAAPTGERRINR